MNYQNSTDEFIPVRKHRGKRRLKVKDGNCLETTNSSNSSNLTDSSLKSSRYLTNEDITRKLATAKDHLEYSGFFSYFQELLIKSLQALEQSSSDPPIPLKIVCFGLGTFSECIIARYQLAFLVALRKSLDIHSVELFDPMFSTQENEVLEELGFQVLQENEEGKRSIGDLTIFYLPHCSHQLVNNLLFANWDAEKLRNCVIISNSFKNIHNSVPPRILCQSLSFISRVGDICDECEVPNSFEYPDIFNDTAIHVFPISKIMSLNINDSFWLERATPVYQESDFVKSSGIKMLPKSSCADSNS